MDLSLLKTRVHLLTLITNSLLTMKATQWRCIESSPLDHFLCPSYVDDSANPSNITSASPKMSQRYCFSSSVSSWTLPHALSVIRSLFLWLFALSPTISMD
ncbi:hypothetical protein DPMN_111591 [Dreissena polymorpha]|uniref:Uncharacterized protein n=1 Tax=Dreissena polymorpha TaxID=45954 RepID=A0A9D4QP65_DREPO|nr:hypothetical protein DPMN_111591 [Dreissena polymorpha]